MRIFVRQTDNHYLMENTRTRLIQDILARMKQMEEYLKAEYLHRSEDVLSRRPAPGRWSIGETAAHTSMVMEIYQAHIKDSLRHTSALPQVKPYKQGFNGRMMISFLQPKNGKVRWKIPTVASMEPQTDDNDTAVDRLNDLITTSRNFRSLVKECSEYDLNKVKVASALGKVIRFRLGDALHIVAVHNERHLVQMENALEKISPAQHQHTGA